MGITIFKSCYPVLQFLVFKVPQFLVFKVRGLWLQLDSNLPSHWMSVRRYTNNLNVKNLFVWSVTLYSRKDEWGKAEGRMATSNWKMNSFPWIIQGLKQSPNVWESLVQLFPAEEQTRICNSYFLFSPCQRICLGGEGFFQLFLVTLYFVN